VFFNAEAVHTSNYHWVLRGYPMGRSELIEVFFSGNVDIFLPDITATCEHFMFLFSLTVIKQ
jgi:hypothetical protein